MAGDDGSLRRVRTWPEKAGADERALLEAALDLVGEQGYGALSISALGKRTGASSRLFHRYFESAAQCFARAFEQLARGLCEELIEVGRRGEDWRSGFRAALATLLAFCAAEPRAARAVLVESRLADRRVLEIREELVGRIHAELERARGELEAAGLHQPPRLAAQMVSGGIEYRIGDALRRGESDGVEGLLDGLAYFGISMYFGGEAGSELG